MPDLACSGVAVPLVLEIHKSAGATTVCAKSAVAIAEPKLPEPPMIPIVKVRVVMMVSPMRFWSSIGDTAFLCQLLAFRSPNLNVAVHDVFQLFLLA